MIRFAQRGVNWLATLILSFAMFVPLLQTQIASAVAPPPTASIDSPISGATEGGTVDVNASVSDTDLAGYKTILKNASALVPCPANVGPGDPSIVYNTPVTPTGGGPVTIVNQLVASFDSTLFTDGAYYIQFCARDTSSPAASAFTIVNQLLNIDNDTPPIIDTHADELAEATSAAGAVVNYTPPNAVDAVDGTSPATCLPAPGSLFPLGITTVTCNATDSDLNAAVPTTFDVIVSDSTPPFVTAFNPMSGDFLSDGLNIRAQANDPNTGIDNVTFEVVGGVTGSTDMPWVNGNNYRFVGFNTNTELDGVYTFLFTATNNDGDTTTTTSTNVTIDNTQPTASIDSPVGGVYVNGNVPIVGSFADPNIQDYKVLVATQSAGTTCQDDITDPNIVFATAWTPSGDQTNAILANFDSTTVSDGKYLAFICARDKADNRRRVHNGPSGFNVDNTPPVISNVPSDQTIEATGPSGAVATWTDPDAIDAVDGVVPVSCVPASGSTFPITTTLVTCTATDSLLNSSNVTFNITVEDTTKPVLSLPANIAGVAATSPSGAIVNYAASAADNIDGPIGISCNPASGATFAIGITTVNCSATDSNGNTQIGSFTITVDPQPVAPAQGGAGGGGDEEYGNDQGENTDANVLADQGNNEDSKVKAADNQNSNNQDNKSNNNWWWILLLLGIAGIIGFIIYKQTKENE